MRFLRNFPLPEPILAGIILGVVLHYLVPLPLLPALRPVTCLGAGLLAGGAGLILWATAHAADVTIAEPDRLLTEGPYRFSRNPMYVGWIVVSAGLGFVLHSFWILSLTVLAFIYLHLVQIPKEECALQARFGEAYAAYRRDVRRYL